MSRLSLEMVRLAAGDLTAFARMDGASILSGETVRRKVYTVSANRNGRGGEPPPPRVPGTLRAACLDVREDVGLAARWSGRIATVRPGRVTHRVRGGAPRVVAAERSRLEEAEVGVPLGGADIDIGPGPAVVGRQRLEGLDQLVPRIVPIVVPDRMQMAAFVCCDGGFVLV